MTAAEMKLTSLHLMRLESNLIMQDYLITAISREAVYVGMRLPNIPSDLKHETGKKKKKLRLSAFFRIPTTSTGNLCDLIASLEDLEPLSPQWIKARLQNFKCWSLSSFIQP